jgi:hypothetical protein
MRVSTVLLRGAADFIGAARLSDMTTPANNGALRCPFLADELDQFLRLVWLSKR